MSVPQRSREADHRQAQSKSRQLPCGVAVYDEDALPLTSVYVPSTPQPISALESEE
ncbi:hypothetical protein [Halalkalibacterium halodurans]|uniref:hypothetical protein n=1 Tax=Halalkalibacterium halodurans TaxID=86665 RepID=UPI002AAA5EF2|nr:hypothetical protein [Halalkalibacterium halodurans]MDY7220852.1 hypothetical protein [Halalkalibacterium halodurans]MDY7240091.1 hypothetical protein [Halalkalibacterium halodurans]